MNRNVIEGTAINKVKELFMKMEVDYNNLNIVYEIQENDKTPDTDGFIRINKTQINHQVKGTTKINNKYVIKKQYLDYAKKQSLLFIVVTGINNDFLYDEIYYEFIGIDFIERLAQKNKKFTNQGSITHEFTKKLTNFSEFMKDFELEEKNSHTKKIIGLGALAKKEQKIKFKTAAKNEFQDSIRITDFKVKDLITDIEYYPERGLEIELGYHKEKITYDGIELSKSTDLFGNTKIETRFITIDLSKIDNKINPSINYRVSFPEFLHEITENEIMLLQKLEIEDINPELCEYIQNIKKLYSLKSKIYAMIPESYIIKSEDANKLYSLLYSEVLPTVTPPQFHLFLAQDKIIPFIFNNEKRMYELITEDTKASFLELNITITPLVDIIINHEKYNHEGKLLYQFHIDFMEQILNDTIKVIKQFQVKYKEKTNQILFYCVLVFDRSLLENEEFEEIINSLYNEIYESDETTSLMLLIYLFYMKKMNKKIAMKSDVLLKRRYIDLCENSIKNNDELSINIISLLLGEKCDLPCELNNTIVYSELSKIGINI